MLIGLNFWDSHNFSCDCPGNLVIESLKINSRLLPLRLRSGSEGVTFWGVSTIKVWCAPAKRRRSMSKVHGPSLRSERQSELIFAVSTYSPLPGILTTNLLGENSLTLHGYC